MNVSAKKPRFPIRIKRINRSSSHNKHNDHDTLTSEKMSIYIEMY